LEALAELFPVIFHRLPVERMTPVLTGDEFRIFASPVHDLIPTIGLRIEAVSGGTLAYSCDTEPCDEVVELANGADILIHETSGDFQGHTSASQAGSIASRAEVDTLYLIHYDPQETNPLPDAKKEFPGKVALAEDFLHIPL